MATFQPRSARSIAHEAPSPVAEPVTIATLPDFAMCPSPISRPALHRLGSGPKAKWAGHGRAHGRSVFDEEPRGAADRRLARPGPGYGDDPGRCRRHGAVRRPYGERAGGDG